jgi:hypothetical protein
MAKFDKPTNTWLEEDVMVRTLVPTPTEKGVKFELKDVPTKQKVMYVDAPKQTVICAKGKHSWYCKNPKKGLFACHNCKLERLVHPVTYKFENGQLINKRTGDIL